MKLVYKGVNPKTNRVEWYDEDAELQMEEWVVVRYRAFVEAVEPLLGRKLTREEYRTINWLCGFEEHSVHNILRLIKEAYQSGTKQKD